MPEYKIFNFSYNLKFEARTKEEAYIELQRYLNDQVSRDYIIMGPNWLLEMDEDDEQDEIENTESDPEEEAYNEEEEEDGGI